MIQIDKSWPINDGAVWRLQRGAEYVLAANRYPSGSFSVVAEGVGCAPILRSPAAYELASLCQDETKLCTWSGIDLRGEARGAGICADRGVRLDATDCVVATFSSGVSFGGVGSKMTGLKITGCASGIIASNSAYKAASYGVISRCNVTATRDAITLHDGKGEGVGNVIEDCDLFGDIENGIDILSQYSDTIVRRNRIRSAQSYPLIWDGARTLVYGNVLWGTRCAIYSRGADAVIVDNTVESMASNSAATIMAFSPRATGQRVQCNRGEMLAGTQRDGYKFEPGSGGICIGNKTVNRSAMQTYGDASADWRVA